MEKTQHVYVARTIWSEWNISRRSRYLIELESKDIYSVIGLLTERLGVPSNELQNTQTRVCECPTPLEAYVEVCSDFKLCRLERDSENYHEAQFCKIHNCLEATIPTNQPIRLTDMEANTKYWC